MYYVKGKMRGVRINTENTNEYFDSESEAQAWADKMGLDGGYDVFHKDISDMEEQVDIHKPIRYKRYEEGYYEND